MAGRVSKSRGNKPDKPQIRYTEPASYFPKAVWEAAFGKEDEDEPQYTQCSIDDYKDGMTGPVGIVPTDPESKKPKEA